MVQTIKAFLENTQQEFQRVNWPTGAETVRLTIMVIVMSLGVAIFLGAFDFLFTFLLGQVIS